jgi:P27 family predicted phage terminase small subunit
MKGRKPKPLEQKRREGNPGKRKLGQPVKIRAGAPEKPKNLPPAGSALWDEIVAVLHTARVADAIDAPALTALCVQWARAEQARAALRKDGIFALGSTGQLTEHPALGIERAAHGMFLRFAEQYGLTAAARSRIALVGAAGAIEAEAERAAVLDLKPRLVSG